MFRYLLIALIVCMMSVNALADDFPTTQTYYVSSSQGSDQNPGTEALPRKTLSSLTTNQKKHATILLKRGDVFSECIYGLDSCNISSYGTGDAPVVCGLFSLNRPEAWQQVNDSVWRLDLSDTSAFSGFGYSHPISIANLGNIGLIYHPASDTVYGNMVSHIDSLKQGSFYTSSVYVSSQLTDSTFKYVYFCWPNHPSELGQLCFSSGAIGIFNCHQVSISDISIVGFGKNGLQALDSTYVARCSFDLIGGSILIDNSKWTRFGNAIEVNLTNGPHSDVDVTRCTISRVYDTATTIQGHGTSLQSPRRIRFHDNTIIHCRQGYEWYLNSTNTNPQYAECSFDDNLLLESGYNQFGIPAQVNDSHFLSYDNKQPPMPIFRNTCYGGNYLCVGKANKGISRNMVYLYSDQYLNHYVSNNYPPIYPPSITSFRNRMGDNSDVIVIQRDSDIDLHFRTLVRQHALERYEKLFRVCMNLRINNE